jgi:NTE family protein
VSDDQKPVPGLGLCLTGGGITGAMYQVGCLAALEECFTDFRATDFAVFVGSSSGATVALALAGGLPASRLYRALLDPADDFFPLQRQHLLRLDRREWSRVFKSGFSAARQFVSTVSSRPRDVDLWEELERFIDSLPAGIFSLDHYEQFVTEFMRRRGLPPSFARFDRKLFVVAHDLDSGERKVFGLGDLAEIPVPRAIAASGAIPILFAPVRIGDRDYVDGGLGDVGHVDIAIDAGCDSVLVVNAMVPVPADDLRTGGRRTRIRDKGMFWVNNQSWRMRAEARFRRLLDSYVAAHAESSILLLEPKADDRVMFLNSPMNFAARRVILEDSFKSTVAALRRPDSALRALFEKKGLKASGVG